MKMKMKMRMKMLSLVVAAFLGGVLSGAATERPNIIVMLCDDLGHGDLSCYGHEIIKTPNLDGLASGGLRFTDCYAASTVCSPSRAGLFTGRNPNRAGIYDWIGGGPVHLRREETTLPALLQKAGYATMLSGKWHLNGRFNQPDLQPTPGDHGFDYWFATSNNAGPNHHNPQNFVRNGKKVGKIEGYSSSIVVQEALGWIDGRKEKKKPFAVFLTFHEPHQPIASPPDLIKQYKPFETIPGQADYWANVAQVDRAVGELLKGLEDRKVRDNTLLVFTSDNGPEEWMRYPGVWNSHGTPGAVDGVPFRGWKLDVFEGGIRVCGIVNWPAEIKQGRVVSVPICATDLLPTLCEVAEAKVPANLHLDGTSIMPLICGGDSLTRSAPLFWFYYNARGYANFALRDGDYMLLARRTGPQYRAGTPYTPDRFPGIGETTVRSAELYNLRTDPMEVVNLAKKEPDRLKAMQVQLEEQLKDIQKTAPSWRKDNEEK
ncbi:MAG: sulfatase-like hydrolase/transferase [Pontiella sp.]